MTCDYALGVQTTEYQGLRPGGLLGFFEVPIA